MRYRGFHRPFAALLLGIGVALLATTAYAKRQVECAVVAQDLNGATLDKRIECVDGDPACDADGTCDGTCRFQLRLCGNQCTDGSPLATSIRVRGASLEIPDLARGAACGGYVPVTTKRKKGKKPKPGKARVVLSAKAGKKAVDKDTLTLLCRPRTDACPPQLEVKNTVVEAMPPLSVDPPAPTADTPVTVRVERSDASAIVLTASGTGCGGLSTHGPAPSPLVVTAPAGAFGVCDLTAQLTTGAGSETLVGRFMVAPRDLAVPALSVNGGIFQPGPLPPASGDPAAPGIAGIDGPTSLVNGGSAQLRIRLLDPSRLADVRAVQLSVGGGGGAEGYWEAPATIDGDSLVIEATLNESFGAAAITAAGTLAPQATGALDLLVQLVDRLGRVGDRIGRALETIGVTSGSVQVSLSWDSPTDVDLHVVEPGGDEIYYSNRTSGTGGTLDLDSNAGCSIDGVNNENVSWPGESPVGEYVVRVDFWSDCASGENPGFSANWTVTTKVCGQTTIYSGFFPAGTADRGGRGSGVEVARFTSDCRRRVRGKAMYEDRAQTSTGLAAAATTLPIRFAKVEVKRAADDAVLGEGATKQDGSFDVGFTNDGQPGYYVVVSATRDAPIVQQSVVDDRGTIYAVRSDGSIDDTQEPDKTGLEITAPTGTAGPAFNIFDMGVIGASLVRRVHGSTPPMLTWLWTSGKQGTCTSAVSCYKRASDTISVLSLAADPDEYDDLVLLHEYGHFWQYHYSKSDSPGGNHALNGQYDPRLSWGEGSATFFGNIAGGSSLYLDTSAAGIGVRFDLESLPASVPNGTAGGTMSGNLSEAIVAGVIWDLADATNEAKDTVSNRDAVFDAMGHLNVATTDRGVAGVDLVDMLDSWFCRGADTKGDATTGVQGIVTGIHGVPYDFADVGTCP